MHSIEEVTCLIHSKSGGRYVDIGFYMVNIDSDKIICRFYRSLNSRDYGFTYARPKDEFEGFVDFTMQEDLSRFKPNKLGKLKLNGSWLDITISNSPDGIYSASI